MVFFIRQQSIEVCNFLPFTQAPQGRTLLNEMITSRVHQEIDIEGVAVACEVWVKAIPLDQATIGIDEALKECTDTWGAVMLSLDWRGIGSTFGRIAKKTQVQGKCKLIGVHNTEAIEGPLANFFPRDKVPIRERLNLQ
jgi:hypothetical protein